MRRPGDRRDGKLIRDLDSLHYVTGILYPNRCDNEAFVSIEIDLTKTREYLKQKNAARPDYPYNLFQLIVTAVLKAITLRPKMNRFIVNGNFYQRNEVSTSFVVKKSLREDAEEALAFIHAVPQDTLETIRTKMKEQIDSCRSKKADGSTESMNFMNHIPRFLSRKLIRFIMKLDRKGRVPGFFISSDPYYSSCVISNLGSIRMKSGYHHLTNWGTCSMILLIGERKRRPKFSRDGAMTMIDSVELGVTIDERLADGFYYARTMELIRKLVENPELLEDSLEKEMKA